MSLRLEIPIPGVTGVSLVTTSGTAITSTPGCRGPLCPTCGGSTDPDYPHRVEYAATRAVGPLYEVRLTLSLPDETPLYMRVMRLMHVLRSWRREKAWTSSVAGAAYAVEVSWEPGLPANVHAHLLAEARGADLDDLVASWATKGESHVGAVGSVRAFARYLNKSFRKVPHAMAPEADVRDLYRLLRRRVKWRGVVGGWAALLAAAKPERPRTRRPELCGPRRASTLPPAQAALKRLQDRARVPRGVRVVEPRTGAEVPAQYRRWVPDDG